MGIIGVLFVKVLAGVFAFPVCAILITQSSPSRELLGTVNGANQALCSLCRAIGPSIAGYMYSRSLELSKPWIVWRYGLGLFAIIVWIGGWFLNDEHRLPNPTNYMRADSQDADDTTEEESGDEGYREQDTDSSKNPVRFHIDENSSDDDELAEGVSTHLLNQER